MSTIRSGADAASASIYSSATGSTSVIVCAPPPPSFTVSGTLVSLSSRSEFRQHLHHLSYAQQWVHWERYAHGLCHHQPSGRAVSAHLELRIDKPGEHSGDDSWDSYSHHHHHGGFEQRFVLYQTPRCSLVRGGRGCTCLSVPVRNPCSAKELAHRAR